jgi:AraC-like DNA-binding protein
MGTTLTDYVHRSKVRESLPLLASRKYDVARIAFLFGYSSPSHYTKAFIRQMGSPPSNGSKSRGSEHAAPRNYKVHFFDRSRSESIPFPPQNV